MKVFSILTNIHYGQKPITVIISGGASGADYAAQKWAECSTQGVRTEIYNPNWRELGPKAGPIRNQRMLDEGRPDLVIAFPGGKGTADMVRRAKKMGVEIMEIS